MTTVEKIKKCGCDGACPGYGTRQNCPPLIVIAVAATAKGTVCR